MTRGLPAALLLLRLVCGALAMRCVVRHVDASVHVAGMAAQQSAALVAQAAQQAVQARQSASGVPPISLIPGIRPLPPGMPPAPPGGAPQDGAPDAKKTKPTIPLVPEEIWTELHPDPIDIKVVVPDEPANHKHSFYGQSVTLVDRGPKVTVKELKEELVKHLTGLGANKIKLSTVKHGVLKDAMTIAHYNFLKGENMMAGIKERGGKK